MKSKHSYVVLIDLPEVLPFVFDTSKISPDKIQKIDSDSMKSEKLLIEFITEVEKEFKNEFSFIGEDVISEKFYKRFLIEDGGFIEIMYQTPAAIIAHFIEEKKAERFADSLKKVIRDLIKDPKAATVLENLVEVNTEKEEPLTYKKWSKLSQIRGLVSK